MKNNKKAIILALLTICTLSSYANHTLATTANDRGGSFYQTSVNQMLNDILQVNIDNFNIYHQASKKIKDKELKSFLIELAKLKQERISVLSKIITENRGIPTLFDKTYTNLPPSTIDTSKSKLKILESIEVQEIISNRRYHDALSFTMPREIKSLLHNILDNNENILKNIHDMQEKLKSK